MSFWKPDVANKAAIIACKDIQDTNIMHATIGGHEAQVGGAHDERMGNDK